MAQGNKLEIKDAGIVLAHSANADSVATAQITIESRLGSIVLVKDLDGGLRSRGAPQGLSLAGVVAKGLLDGLG